MKCKIDKAECIGCGLCASYNSNVFIEDSDGKFIAKDVEINDNNLSSCQDAIDNCPAACIHIED